MKRLLFVVISSALTSCFNPMLRSFLVDVSFVNEAGQAVELAFLGKDPKGDLHLLNIYSGPSFLPFPAGQNWFTVEPSNTLRITYDWDDLNPAYVPVRPGKTTGYSRLNPPEKCRYESDSSLYHIPGAGLVPAPESLLF